MKSIGVSDLRKNLPATVREVERGEIYEVTTSGRPVAYLTPSISNGDPADKGPLVDIEGIDAADLESVPAAIAERLGISEGFVYQRGGVPKSTAYKIVNGESSVSDLSLDRVRAILDIVGLDLMVRPKVGGGNYDSAAEICDRLNADQLAALKAFLMTMDR